MEGSQVPRVQNGFWKRLRVKVVYVGGNKMLLESEGQKVKTMRVLYMRSGGSTYRVHSVILFSIMDIEKKN